MLQGNPWLSIWVRPRETIRGYLQSENPEQGIVWLAVLAGFLNGLDTASNRNMYDQTHSMVQIFLAAGIGGIIGGLITLYLGSWLLRVTGRWVGGQGTTTGLRVATARGFFMPSILLGLLWIPQLLLFGKEMFTSETPRIDASSGLTAIFFTLTVLEVVLFIWAFIVGLKAIGEAHEFSAWRALGNVLLALLIVIAVAVVVALVIALLFSAV